jgi:GST-like protein
VSINPNSKIPCGEDLVPADGGPPVRLFESGAMMMYLADKVGGIVKRHR